MNNLNNIDHILMFINSEYEDDSRVILTGKQIGVLIRHIEKLTRIANGDNRVLRLIK